MTPAGVPLPLRRGARGWLVFSALVAAVAAVFILRHFHFGTSLDVAAYDYPPAAPGGCERTRADADDGGPRIVVRAPANYAPSFAHPLLVVFSPAGFSATLSERHLGITRAATAAGLIVAYVDSRPLSMAVVEQFAQVPERVARRWCIDRGRVTLAGHSDGGTVAQVAALLQARSDERPAAVVASAAGLRAQDFAAFDCPQSLQVQLWHGSGDRHFAGYGASAAGAWARCLACSDDHGARDADGCVVYAGCRGSLRYCEHDGGHLSWPAPATDALIALAAAVRRAAK